MFTNHWLHARFSFSPGAWQQPWREGFGPLRALNEDIVQPGTGFDMHPRRDLDIFMLPLSGVVEHRDSLGHLVRVRPGQVQRMFAGNGIRHSQMNASMSELDHHLQIWLTPRHAGGTPTVEARDFDLFNRPGEWCPVISPDGRAGSFIFDAGAFMATTSVREGEAATWWPREGSMVYLHAMRWHRGRTCQPRGARDPTRRRRCIGDPEDGCPARACREPGTGCAVLDLRVCHLQCCLTLSRNWRAQRGEWPPRDSIAWLVPVRFGAP